MAQRIGELFVSKGLITEEQLGEALQNQARSGKFLGEILVDLGYATEESLLMNLADQFNTRFVTLSNVVVNPEITKIVPRALVWEYQFLPIETRASVMLIAVSNPLDMWPMSVVKEKIGLAEVQIVLATKRDIKESLLKYYGPESETGNV